MVLRIVEWTKRPQNSQLEYTITDNISKRKQKTPIRWPLKTNTTEESMEIIPSDADKDDMDVSPTESSSESMDIAPADEDTQETSDSFMANVPQLTDTQFAHGSECPNEPQPENAQALREPQLAKPLFCCDKVQLQKTSNELFNQTADGEGINLLFQFINNHSTIRLEANVPNQYVSPDYLIIVADNKTKNFHWFMTHDTQATDTHGLYTLRTFEEYERVEPSKDPVWVSRQKMDTMMEEYPSASFGKVAIICPVHSTDRWFVSVGKKDVAKELQRMDGSLLTMGFDTPPTAASAKEIVARRRSAANKK